MTDRLTPEREAEIRALAASGPETSTTKQALDELLCELDAVRCERDALVDEMRTCPNCCNSDLIIRLELPNDSQP